MWNCVRQTTVSVLPVLRCGIYRKTGKRLMRPSRHATINRDMIRVAKPGARIGDVVERSLTCFAERILWSPSDNNSVSYSGPSNDKIWTTVFKNFQFFECRISKFLRKSEKNGRYLFQFC